MSTSWHICNYVSMRIDALFGRSRPPLFDWELEETTIAGIKSFDKLDIEDEEELTAMWEMIYEIEYKYSMLKSRPFEGLPERRERLLDLLEEKGREVVGAVAKTLIIVFEDWLDTHAITTPNRWAEKRIEELEDIYGDSYGELLGGVLSEYGQYSGHTSRSNRSGKTAFASLMQRVEQKIYDMPVTEEVFTDFLQEDMVNMASADLEDVENEYMDIEEWNERYGLDAKDAADASMRLTDIEINLSDYPITDHYLFTSEAEFRHFLSSIGYNRAIGMLTEMYRFIVFPLWYDYWSSQGIDGTRATVEDAYEELRKLSSLPIEKQFAVLNHAKNVEHQTGSMMEYYEERWRVDPDTFEELSSRSVDDWNIELKEIGVAL